MAATPQRTSVKQWRSTAYRHTPHGNDHRTAPRNQRQSGIMGCVLSAIVLLAGCMPWTIRPIATGQDTQAQGVIPGKPGFSAAAYVDSIWASQVLPTIDEQAHDLQQVLTALQEDPDTAKQQYGYREGQRPHNFLVKGEATVLATNTTSRTRTLTIDLAPGDGAPDAIIQIGPVIRGTSLRDALPFIQFNQFTNQLDYADVSNALNDHVVNDVAGAIDPASLQGKAITFQGAFTLGQGADILITPTELQAK